MKKHFFNCTELVLVVFCSAIIAALTIAAAGSMALDPRTIACADIVRSLEKKFVAWENDHDGRVISAYDKGKFWGRQLADGGYFDADGFYRGSKRYPKNFQCPAETRLRSNGKKMLEHPTTTFADSYDYSLNWGTHYKTTKEAPLPKKRSELQNPAAQMRMLEGTKYAIWHTDTTNRTARHGENASNVLFADGHVEFVDMVPFKNMPNFNLKFWTGK